MQITDIDYPSYTHDESIGDYQNITAYCSDYMCRVLESALRLKRPANPDCDKGIQQKLLVREKRIRSHIKFNANKCFTDYKTSRRQRVANDISKIGLFTGQKLPLMAPVAESIMIRAQMLYKTHQEQLSRIEAHLKLMTYLNEVDACDNPLVPLNLFHLLLSSIDIEYLSLEDIDELVTLIDKVFDQQLADMYTQIEVGLASVGYRSSQIPIDITITATVDDARPEPREPAKKRAATPLIEDIQNWKRNKAKLFSMTEELLEDLILDEHMMLFFFDEWQCWLRQLCAEHGFHSSAINSAFKVLGALTRMLEYCPEESPAPSELRKIEEYIEQAWETVDIDSKHYRKVLALLHTGAEGLR